MAEVAAAAVALVACVATSPANPAPEPDEPEQPPGEEEWEPEPRSAEVVLHNALAQPAVVRLRRLAPAVDVECASLRADPGALLTEALLGPTQTWTIPAGDNLGIDATGGRPCAIVRLQGDGFAPRWLLWEPGTRAPVSYQPQVPPEGPGVVTLSPEGSGAVLLGGEDLVFVPAESPRGIEVCAPMLDGQRVEWGDPMPEGGTLVSATWGPDGCGSVVLTTEDEATDRPWFVCIPEPAWPFVPGDALQVQSLFGTDALEVTAVGAQSEVIRNLHVYRSSRPLTLLGIVMDYVSDESCDYDVDTTCGTVTRVGGLEVHTPGGETITLHPGDVASGVQLPDRDSTARVEVLAAQERIALDPECALGPDTLGPDLALVITQEGEE